ncbi:2-dehydro-3-deoxygalactonokinase [Ferrovibrio sp.]|uniref:2-dehydro-3-deoxygalactonokinase n=1 Tax=Ferrovibrio sp. TaxID=1917215 RepID=UPI001B67BE6D|nr:2-dehydro-3-deoxygalactonokinase [Ferrovibrio sp.]MBP7066110.1 2-dehydro-3-deoxygalactonokinase [Ferrovibrio sp.]
MPPAASGWWYEAALIVIDWGSTGFRAWRLDDASGAIQAQCAGPYGITALRPGEHGPLLKREIGTWLAEGESFVLAAGMIGSRQGWHEMPYIPCPAGLADLAQAARRMPWNEGPDIWFCPGLCCRDDQGVPDVIRGEEMQVFGLLDEAAGDSHFCLPGTHGKAVLARDGKVIGFATHFTGELYALLSRHGLLASVLQPPSAPDPAAFAAGVARSGDPGGLLHHVFGVRARALFGEVSGMAAAEYLSGILIGHELRQLPSGPQLILAGEGALVARYAEAAGLLGLNATLAPAHAAARGLYRLGCLLQ